MTMERSAKVVFFAAVLGLPCAVLAQAPRMEAEAGAATFLAAAQRDFERAKPGVRFEGVPVNSTSGALAKLCRGEIGIAGTARAAGKAEREVCAQNRAELIEIAVAMDSIAVVVNPANTWARQLNLADLKRAWLDAPGKATSWKQVNGNWPDTPLKLYGPAPKLGLASHARTALNPGAADSAPELRTDINATEVLAVVIEGVARDRAALGLLDQATYAANMKRVRLVPVEGLPAFPLYVYTSAKELEDAGTRAYLDHLLANGERLAALAGVAPLAASAYREARQRLAAKR